MQVQFEVEPVLVAYEEHEQNIESWLKASKMINAFNNQLEHPKHMSDPSCKIEIRLIETR